MVTKWATCSWRGYEKCSKTQIVITAKIDLTQPTHFGVHIRQDVGLAALTTIKVGGLADYFATVTTTDQLLNLLRWARTVDLPYFMLGGGSNILISDAGVRGLVVHNRCRAVQVTRSPHADEADERPHFLAESGAALAGAARQSIRAGLTGLEWAVSVPGTLGGAVVGNAGAHGGEIKDNLYSALLMDEEGELCEYRLADFQYAYRNSALKRLQPLRAAFKPVVLSANFRLCDADADEVRQRAEQFLNQRRRTQPVEPSLGSTFMNPPGDYAGRLIEEAGLKGARIGGAEISQLHANFIINRGGVGHATASDVMGLIEHVQTTVAAGCGFELVPEVQLVGEW